MSQNVRGTIRKKAPVQAVHPVKAAHDKYLQSFAADAASPSPSSRRRRDSDGSIYNRMNAMNMGAGGI